VTVFKTTQRERTKQGWFSALRESKKFDPQRKYAVDTEFGCGEVRIGSSILINRRRATLRSFRNTFPLESSPIDSKPKEKGHSQTEICPAFPPASEVKI
jgi:hypothetical protein